MANQIYTKTMHCFIVLSSRLSDFFYFLLHVFKNYSIFWSSSILAQNRALSKKAPPTKVEGIQIYLFNLNQTCKIACTKNCYIWNFSRTPLADICIKSFRETLKIWRYPIIKIWKKPGRVMTKNVYAQTLKKLMKQSREIKQNWTGPINYNNCFSTVFSCYGQSFIFQRNIRYNSLPPTSFKIVLLAPSFLTSEVLSRLGTREATHIKRLSY